MSEIEVNNITFQLAAKLNGKSFVRSGKRRMKCWNEGFDEVLLSDDQKGFTMIKTASEFHHIVVDDEDGGKYWIGVLVFGPRSKDDKLNVLVVKVGRVDKDLNPIEISEEDAQSKIFLDVIVDRLLYINGGIFMKNNDLLAELKELIYRTRNEIEKRYDKRMMTTKTFNYRDVVELVKNPNFDVAEDIPHMLECLLDLNNAVLENKVTVEEIPDLLTIIYNNQAIKNILDKSLCLKYDTIHTELNNEQLAQGVLYFFEQTGNPDHACMYLAPLQKDLRGMIALLGLEETDYEQMWEEIISPKLINNGGYYTNVAIIIFELLRKKKMLMGMAE